MNYAELLHRPTFRFPPETLLEYDAGFASQSSFDPYISCIRKTRAGDTVAVAKRAQMRLDRVMITGAAGSIGSAIVEKLTPIAGRIYACDRNERALAAMNQTSTVRPCLLDVTDRGAVFEAIRCQKPDLVIHAAAYKHVPLMEFHPYEAVTANFMGTKNVIDAIAHPRTDARFVFISTDKAASRATVMGCTKWLAEQYIETMVCTHPRTLSIVRFGNVLGSSGSVIEIWERQLVEGKPLTVVANASRYFCTIDEAALLAIWSSALVLNAECSAISTLKMGEPITMEDLAARFLAFKGVPDHPVELMGLRNGDQATEVLAGDGETLGEVEVAHA